MILHLHVVGLPEDLHARLFLVHHHVRGHGTRHDHGYHGIVLLVLGHHVRGIVVARSGNRRLRWLEGLQLSEDI
jgi:hypothetical protein